MDKPYYTVIIPKGTLLFRSTNTTYDLVKDFAGIPKDSNNFCLFPNFNVFFYPFPFVSETVNKYAYTNIYVLNNDVKLINLISPSPYTRQSRISSKGGIVSCDKVDFKGCTDFGKAYDPCIDFSIVKDGDVVGMIAIAQLDARSLKKLLTESSNSDNNLKSRKSYHRDLYYNNYYRLYKDKRQIIGVPEIILYPRKKIVHDSINETIDDYSDFMIDNMDLFNFSLFFTTSNSDELQDVLESLKSKSGFKNGSTTYNVGLNKETGFYQILNFTDDKSVIDYTNNMGEIHEEFKFVSSNLDELDKVYDIKLDETIKDWIDANDEDKHLILDDLDLKEVPNLPPNVKILSLSENNIKVLKNLPKSLKNLEINNNKISRIEEFPPNLEILKINNNRLNELVDLPKTLIYIYANKNKIEYIDKLPPNLISLEINNNQLSELPDLPNKLKILEAEDNPLRSIGRIPKSITVLRYDIPENNINLNNI